MKDGEYAQFIQVGSAVLAVDKIVRVDLYHEVKYDDGRTMMSARMVVTMSAGDNLVIERDTDEGRAIEEWMLSRTHVLAPMKPATQEVSA